jgi:hypothetical protein
MSVCLISMSPDGHLGTKMLAACCMIGDTLLGCVLAGLTVRPTALDAVQQL